MRKQSFIILSIIFMLSANMLFAEIEADLKIRKGYNIEIDGKPDDPIWKLIEPVPIEKKFGDEEPTVTAFFKMYYTDEFIYLLVDVTDDVHYPSWVAESKEPWMFDKIEVYFDVNDVLKDGNGPAYINGYMDPGHYQFAPAFEEGAYDFAYLPEDVLYGSLSNQVFVAYSLKDDFKSYTIEYEFPLEAFINDRDENLSEEAFKSLPNGMGFDVYVVDNDNDGAGRKRAVWKNDGPSEAYTNMDNCGVVVFENKDVEASSIRAPELLKIELYPNPIKNELIVDAEFDKVTFVNILGQEVDFVGNDRTINVSNLTSGLYIVKVFHNETCIAVEKVIKE